MSAISVHTCTDQAATHASRQSLWAYAAHHRSPKPGRARESPGAWAIRQVGTRLPVLCRADACEGAKGRALQASSGNAGNISCNLFVSEWLGFGEYGSFRARHTPGEPAASAGWIWTSTGGALRDRCQAAGSRPEPAIAPGTATLLRIRQRSKDLKTRR